MHIPDKTALILLQSTAEPGARLEANKKLKEQYSLIDFYNFHIQTAIDYFVPNGYFPVLKQHPSVTVEHALNSGTFGNAYAIPNLFTGVLMKLLHEIYTPTITLEANSSLNTMVDGLMKIKYYGVLNYPGFYHKYFPSLVVLNLMGAISQDAGKYFRRIIRDQQRLSGEGREFFHMYYVEDIKSLVRLNFPQAPAEASYDYEVMQELLQLDWLLESCEEKEFVIFLDVWQEISVNDVRIIAEKYSISVIKMEKILLKPKKKIIDSLTNDYMFVISKNPSIINPTRDFAFVKNNRTMGIKVLCYSISMEQYLMDMTERMNKEKVIRDVKESQKYATEMMTSVQKLVGTVSKLV